MSLPFHSNHAVLRVEMRHHMSKCGSRLFDLLFEPMILTKYDSYCVVSLCACRRGEDPNREAKELDVK